MKMPLLTERKRLYKEKDFALHNYFYHTCIFKNTVLMLDGYHSAVRRETRKFNNAREYFDHLSKL